MDPYVTGSLISGGASLLGGLFGRNTPKIPAPKTAEQMKSDMDVMYAGTTPWERLGASGGGVPQAAASQDASKIQARVQQQQHKNQMQITAINAASNAYKADLDYKAKIKTSPFASMMDPDVALEGTVEGIKNQYNKGKTAVERWADKNIRSKETPSQSLSDKPKRSDAGAGTKKSVDFSGIAKELYNEHKSPPAGGKRKRSNKRR